MPFAALQRCKRLQKCSTMDLKSFTFNLNPILAETIALENPKFCAVYCRSWTPKWTTHFQFPCARNHSKRRRRWVGVKGSTRNGCRNHKCPSTRRLRMVREDTWAPSKGAIYAWMVADEEVGFTREFLAMWWSSGRVVCRGRSEPGLCVNDISRIHWPQHLLATQGAWPN
ncbi:uncharacterized protein TNCV_4364501 [Trichonephila clavipes]|nr:uncharacterized protein TNCV_4364501 [Trichonephila clavipes]